MKHFSLFLKKLINTTNHDPKKCHVFHLKWFIWIFIILKLSIKYTIHKISNTVNLIYRVAENPYYLIKKKYFMINIFWQDKYWTLEI